MGAPNSVAEANTESSHGEIGSPRDLPVPRVVTHPKPHRGVRVVSAVLFDGAVGVGGGARVAERMRGVVAGWGFGFDLVPEDSRHIGLWAEFTNLSSMRVNYFPQMFGQECHFSLNFGSFAPNWPNLGT